MCLNVEVHPAPACHRQTLISAFSSKEVSGLAAPKPWALLGLQKPWDCSEPRHGILILEFFQWILAPFPFLHCSHSQDSKAEAAFARPHCPLEYLNYSFLYFHQSKTTSISSPAYFLAVAHICLEFRISFANSSPEEEDEPQVFTANPAAPCFPSRDDSCPAPSVPDAQGTSLSLQGHSLLQSELQY